MDEIEDGAGIGHAVLLLDPVLAAVAGFIDAFNGRSSSQNPHPGCLGADGADVEDAMIRRDGNLAGFPIFAPIYRSAKPSGSDLAVHPQACCPDDLFVNWRNKVYDEILRKMGRLGDPLRGGEGRAAQD